MKKALALIGAVALAGTTAMTALAGPDDDQLFIDGVSIVTDVAGPEGSPFDTLYSGWRYRSDETQALQIDDFENPAFAAVDDGLELWQTAAGTSGKSCADCHGDIGAFKGLRAGMPKWNAAAGKPWALEHWINWSITEHQGGEKWKWESKQMLAMTSLIASVSRGMPVSVQIDGPMAAPTGNFKKQFWQQAEVLVGFLALLDLTGDERYWDAFLNVHDFVFDKFVHLPGGGEWFHLLERDGTPIEDHLADDYKISYHTVRAMIEVARRLPVLRSVQR